MMMVLAAGWLSVSVATAQAAANLTIVSGNGQMVCPACSLGADYFFQTMIVQATDVNGNPVPGATVNWNIVSGGGSFFQSASNTYSSTTSATGQTSATFQLFSAQAGSGLFSVAPITITASTGSLVATFYANEALQDPAREAGPVSAVALNNSLLQGVTYSGQLGTTVQTPIQIGVFNEGGQGVPNVAVFLVDAETFTGAPTIACAGTAGAGPNLVLTDSSGLATCYPVFGGSPGTGLFWVDVGGAQSTTAANFPSSEFLTFPLNPYNPSLGTGTGYNFTVTPGTPGSTTVISGSSQSATPGQALGQPLVAEVLNSSGQPLSGIAVNWTVSPANAAALAPTTTTGANGQTSNSVTLTGSASGTITITATATGSNSKAVFTVSAIPLVTVTSFQIVSGNNQSAVQGAAFAQPLVVQVTTSNGVASGITVQFLVQSGPVSLSATSVATNSNGQAQVTAQAGSVPGSATVLATITSTSGSSSQTFSLTVLPPGPAISAANFYNGADQQPNSLSPCGLGLLIGSSPLGIPNVSPMFPGLPAAQTTVSITFNSISAPILNIGNTALGQQFILFQVPCQLSPATSVPVTVDIAGATANVNLNVQAAAPGVFHVVMSDGVARAVLVRPDGSFVSLSNPARRGETEVAYVTGLGATSTTVGTTAVPVPGGAPATVLGDVIPGMNGGGLPLVSAQLSEDLPGIYVVAFQIPATEATGNNVPFSIGIIPVGGSTVFYSALTFVPVQ
jgi:uncharacterized protein (TIGR03437 family)